MATVTKNNVQSLLGDKAESLLGFDSPKIPKERLQLPGRRAAYSAGQGGT